MTILAFDTCFGACSAAVWSRARNCVLAERFETMEKGHSERIVPMIGEVLASASVSLGDLAAIAVTVGPGSFTGVRTGLAVARALGLARGIQIRGTTSLHVMAARLRDSHADMPIAIAVATRDRLVYVQTFALADAAPASPARLATAEEAARDLGAVPHAIAGTGAGLVVAAAAEIGISHRHVIAPAEVHAGVLARLAGGLPVLDPPQPLYLREPDAKPQPGCASPTTPMRT